MKKLALLLIVCFVWSVQDVYAVSTCPKAYWWEVYQQCQSEDVTLTVGICSEDLSEPGVVFDHIEWNYGDGSVGSTTNLSVLHHYANDGLYTVTATAHFVVDGVPCSSLVVNLSGAGSPYGPLTAADYSYYCSDTAIVVPNLFVNVLIASLNSDMWLTPVGPYHTGQTVTFQPFVSNMVGSDVWNYNLVVNSVSIASGWYSSSGLQATIPYNITQQGQYIAELVMTNPKMPECILTETIVFEVDTVEPPCSYCLTFKPEPGKRYWVSAWVKVVNSSDSPTSIPQVVSYDNGVDANTAGIELGFIGPSPLTVYFKPSGDIIEGWQRIAGEFTVPSGATEVNIKLNHPNSGLEGTRVAYFDDIRIHPFNASMKSYVNDPETFWLTAELDDNNYATFYEYDMEGKLIRIKKETNRGIVTIKESRSSNPKTN